MAKSLRLSGKFNAEEAKIIKDFMEKHYHFQTPNQLVGNLYLSSLKLQISWK